MTLRDYMIEAEGETSSLWDASSGREIVGEAGEPDDPADYEVLASHRGGGYGWAAVCGPSGAIDVYGPDSGELRRDVICDPERLAVWVDENFPG